MDFTARRVVLSEMVTIYEKELSDKEKVAISAAEIQLSHFSNRTFHDQWC